MANPLIEEGSVDVVAGSLDVKGNDTAFLLRGAAYGTFYCQGLAVPIKAVNDNSGAGALKLAFGFPGKTGSNVPYAIAPPQLEGLMLSEALTRVNAVIARIEAGSFLQPDATGTAAQRAAYDGREQGFVYVRTDLGDDYQVSVKRSSANADWGPYKSWLPIAGPQGLPGANGTNGVGNYYDPSIQIPWRPPTGELYKTVFVRPVNFPSSLAGSIGKAGAAADDDAVFAFLQNGVQFGTATFAAAGTTATFAGTSTNFAAGDILSIVAPDPRDATLADVLITLAGARL